MNKKFKIKTLADALITNEFIEFAFVFGSAKNGLIKEGSDLDLAVFFNENNKVGFEEIADIFRVINKMLY